MEMLELPCDLMWEDNQALSPHLLEENGDILILEDSFANGKYQVFISFWNKSWAEV